MGIAVYFIWNILESVPLFYTILEEPMESFLRMLNAQMILLVYLAVGMYCVKVGLIDLDSKEKLVDRSKSTRLNSSHSGESRMPSSA